MNRAHIQKKEHGPCIEVSAIQASPVTLTVYGDERGLKVYCNFVNIIRQLI